jgi:hypothetical protein
LSRRPRHHHVSAFVLTLFLHLLDFLYNHGNSTTHPSLASRYPHSLGNSTTVSCIPTRYNPVNPLHHQPVCSRRNSINIPYKLRLVLWRIPPLPSSSPMTGGPANLCIAFLSLSRTDVSPRLANILSMLLQHLLSSCVYRLSQLRMELCGNPTPLRYHKHLQRRQCKRVSDWTTCSDWCVDTQYFYYGRCHGETIQWIELG